jgi:beta-lactamase superfamily II metal-dependent hydrolase
LLNVRRTSFVCLGFFAARLVLLAFQGIGEPLPVWTPGTLDIHQIQTGRGNAAFFVFPDGTTMLLDAGEVPGEGGRRGRFEIGPQRPNASKSVAGWLASYVQRFGPRGRSAALDYAVVTHYHDDHMGALPEFSRLIPIGTLIDRGEDPPPPTYPVVRAYFDFRRGFPQDKVQKVRVGETGQIDQRQHDPSFEIRVVAANGQVWTGKKNAVRTHFPTGWQKLHISEQPTENDCSIAFLLRYGAFRYFTGGDLAGVPLDYLPAWHDLETPVARATGPVDVAVLNHHGWLDSTNGAFLQMLRPKVAVIPAWHATHPDHSVVRRLRSPGKGIERPELFLTTLLEAPRAVLSYLGSDVFRNAEGHVVVRVAPGGGSYTVLVLDATSEAAPVVSRFGPYQSHGTGTASRKVPKPSTLLR